LVSFQNYIQSNKLLQKFSDIPKNANPNAHPFPSYLKVFNSNLCLKDAQHAYKN